MAIVGGGVASLEIAFCLQRRLRERDPNHVWQLTIHTGGDDVAPGLNRRSRNKLRGLLKQRGIECLTHSKITRVEENRLHVAGGRIHHAECIIWCTHAIAPEWLSGLGLATDERGFLATRSTLQTLSDPDIFAVGDCGTMVSDGPTAGVHPVMPPVPKAGVFAVRQSPVLWRNLQSSAAGLSLERYRPQTRFLKLLNTADQRALLEYGPISHHSKWAWWLKDKIDRDFLKEFQ